MSKKKILVIAPHADDEVLGCGGYLLHESKKGAEIYIMIAVLGGDSAKELQDLRFKELSKVSELLGAKSFKVGWFGCDADLESIPKHEIIGLIDHTFDRIKPDEVFFNYSSHHQDHQRLYECTMASLRLREGYVPKFVALYEYPFVNGSIDTIEGGRFYHDITDVINDKVELFKVYESQYKPAPSPLNEEGIKALARIRGLESGCEYAELFYIQKMIR